MKVIIRKDDKLLDKKYAVVPNVTGTFEPYLEALYFQGHDREVREEQ